MKAKKLMAALGVLVIAVPGVAFANHADKWNEEIVEGHTVFAVLSADESIQMAAIAGLATKRTLIGGVLWFNDQELFGGSQSAAGDAAAGQYVIATQAGDDSPFEHMGATYAESYQFKDPNNVVWIVDRYTYEVCTVNVGGDVHFVPCEAKTANDGTPVDLDEDGHADDITGDGSVPNEDQVIVTTKSIYVAQVADTHILDNPSGTVCGPATGKDYNFVLLVRLDTLSNGVDAGAGHPGAYATPEDAALGQLAGDSHDALDGAHSHTTAQVDLYLSAERPLEPDVREFLFTDAAGSEAPCGA